ncbi:HlyD family secretion protein [Sphingomonas sp. ST-64]|uniref:HlyD family secretion protein n=1 Tax=Sphingomonas plantiphila TaxID=3163295 RepID=A0ABW8YQP3_9SPHN
MADADPRIDTETSEPVAEAQPRQRNWLRRILMFGVPLLLIAAAGAWWAMSGGTVSTDNAYVQQDKVSVASDVAGRIVEVAVKENQRVKAGDLLFRIDPEPYRIALAQADAAIANAQVQVTTLQASYQGTGADIQAARDRIASAQEDFARQKALMDRGFTTRARFEQAQHAVEQARASYQSAVASADEARAKLSSGNAVPGVNPAIAAARAQREKALLDLERTARRAPVDGVISQSDRLQVGQMMMSGLPAVTIVRSGGSWVEANFKETDLAEMRVGQPAEVSFDAYPGLKLKGHVASIGAGTGSEFSVLPAQNANGNWVKVTQRVPVRIAIDEASPRQLIAGLSADVTVITDK